MKDIAEEAVSKNNTLVAEETVNGEPNEKNVNKEGLKNEQNGNVKVGKKKSFRRFSFLRKEKANVNGTNNRVSEVSS